MNLGSKFVLIFTPLLTLASQNFAFAAADVPRPAEHSCKMQIQAPMCTPLTSMLRDLASYYPEANSELRCDTVLTTEALSPKMDSGSILYVLPLGATTPVKLKISLIPFGDNRIYSIDEIIGTDQVGRNAGILRFTLEGNTIEIDHIKVENKFQTRGLSQAMFSRMLKDHPEVTRIKTNLIGTNEAIFDDGLKQGLSTEEAIRQTPAYKIRAREGFTEIEPGSTIPKGSFVAIRPTLSSPPTPATLVLSSSAENILSEEEELSP